MRGLLESRKKKGAVITSPNIFSIISKSMNPYMLNQETLKEIFELRLMLEIGMADFIFNRINKADIEDLKEIVSQEPAQTDTLAFEPGHEIAFHGKLYEITGNDTLKKFQRLLLPIFDYVLHSELIKRQVTIKKYVSHKGLVDTIENGSPEMFRNAMRNHLENYFARLID